MFIAKGFLTIVISTFLFEKVTKYKITFKRFKLHQSLQTSNIYFAMQIQGGLRHSVKYQANRDSLRAFTISTLILISRPVKFYLFEQNWRYSYVVYLFVSTDHLIRIMLFKL